MSKDQVGHVSPLHKVYKMDEVEGLADQNLEYEKIKELFEDKDSKIFDTILLNGPIEIVKNKLNLLRDQGTDVHSVYRSFLYLFSIDQTINFIEFIDWCAASYSTSKKVIMDTSRSKVLFPVSPLVIKNTFSIPEEFNDKYKEYNEEIIVHCFREVAAEKKEELFKACFKPDT